MKRLVAGTLTVAIMAMLVYMGSKRPSGSPASNANESTSPTASPAEARLQTLLQSAWAGDVDVYLASFGDTVRGRLEREVKERGREAFAEDLRRSARSRKSHAVFAPEPDGPEAVRMTVETVYPDRNERQTYRLEPRGADWLVTDVETIHSHQPKVKFGQTAVYQEPEGPPVQSAGVVVETGDTGTEP